jgi:hypothetical protein
MFGKGVFQEEENLLRDIIRSIDKKVDYTAKEGQGSRFTVHIKLRSHEADVMLDIEDLKAAKSDMVRRHQIRQKIKARCDHLDMSRYADDVLGLKPARLLRASPKPEFSPQRSGFGRAPRR